MQVLSPAFFPNVLLFLLSPVPQADCLKHLAETTVKSHCWLGRLQAVGLKLVVYLLLRLVDQTQLLCYVFEFGRLKLAKILQHRLFALLLLNG